MCLAVPARIVEHLANEEALVDAGGVRKRVSVALVPEAAVGDYAVVHAGYAIGLLDPEEAAKTLQLFAAVEAAGA